MNAELLTIDNVCQELGVCKTTVFKLIKKGKLKSAKLGKKRVVKKSDLQDYITNRMFENT